MDYPLLTDILDKFKVFVEQHPQLNTYRYGDITRLNTENISEFPILWLSQNVGRLQGPQTTFVLDMYILDIVEQDFSNEAYVLSDNAVYGNDVVSKFFMDEDQLEGFELDDSNITMTPVRDFDHHLAGWLFRIELDLLHNTNNCNIPHD